MSNAVNSKTFNQEIQWLRQRGVPGEYLELITDRITTAFERNDPDLGNRTIAMIFHTLRSHPKIFMSQFMDREYVGPEMEDLLFPLVSFVRRIERPITKGSDNFVKLGKLIEDFGRNVFLPPEEARRNSVWYRNRWQKVFRPAKKL